MDVEPTDSPNPSHQPSATSESFRDRVARAIGVVDCEIEIITDEKKAFERFHDRLTDFEPSPSPTADVRARPAGGPAASMNAKTPVDASLRSVRTAYRETVMSIPHFEEEYGETLEESLATEYSAEVASQVANGTRLTPMLYQTLVHGAKEARFDRKSFHQSLARERDSLAEIRSGLGDCERELAEIDDRIMEASSSGEFGVLDERLASLEATCTDLLDQRQSLLHDRPGVNLSGVTGRSLVTFLYGDREATCPALADLADCLEAIRDRRQRCLR